MVIFLLLTSMLFMFSSPGNYDLKVKEKLMSDFKGKQGLETPC